MDEDLELREGARRLFHSGRQLLPCASIPALGELTLVLYQDRVGRDWITSAVDWVYQGVEHGNMELFGIGAPEAVVADVAAEIRSRDPLVSPTDAAIVACMFEDPEADVLHTTDGTLLENRSVTEMARERGKKLHELVR